MLSGISTEAKSEKSIPSHRVANLPSRTPHVTSSPVSADSAQAAASRLCLDCGLCCNGVMFDRVMLQPGDNPKALKAHGLKIKRREFFPQPCIALCGTKCTMYQHRPTRCRLFECRQYQQVAAGELAEAEALNRIREVKQQVLVIDSLLEGTVANNPRKSLSQRCASALMELPEGTAHHDGLTTAMANLQAVLADHFRVA